MAETAAATNGKAQQAATAPEPGKSEKILKQVEYYFGDINLPRDKFLQEEMKKDNTWITLSTMLKFNRLASITTDVDLVAAALRDSHLVEVSDDCQKIRRNPDLPLPENTLEYWQEIKRRTVYMKGFPSETTLDEIAEFMGRFGTPQNIIMRKTKGGKETPRIFKGSVFVTYEDQQQAKKLAAMKELKFKENQPAEQPMLQVQMQDDYWATKHLERHQKKELKKEMRKTQIEQQNRQHYKKGMVLKVSGLAEKDADGEPKQEPARIRELKDFFSAFGNPKYVTCEGTEATIRFGDQEENSASTAWKKAVEAAAATKGDPPAEEGKVLMNGQQLEGKVLEGEQESEYWMTFSKAKVTKQQLMKGGGKKQHNRGEKGGGKKFEKRTDNRKRRAEADGGAGPKGKRTIFKEDDDNEDAEIDDVTEEAKPKKEGGGNENAAAGDNDGEPVQQKKAKVEESE